MTYAERFHNILEITFGDEELIKLAQEEYNRVSKTFFDIPEENFAYIIFKDDSSVITTTKEQFIMEDKESFVDKLYEIIEENKTIGDKLFDFITENMEN